MIDDNTGHYNTGYRNTGHDNTGGWNTGDHNTGDWNTGYRNTGGCNTGDCSTGDWNTGHYNTGNRNTGHYNTGYRNTGDWNTGGWNTTDNEAGYFNTVQSDTIRVFNTPVSRKEWEAADKPDFLYFDLTEWVESADMTDEKKSAHPEHETTGGYLKSYGYKEAFQKSWNAARPEDRLLVEKLPGFDPEVFYEISGIRVGDTAKEMTVAEVSELLGYEVKIVK